MCIYLCETPKTRVCIRSWPSSYLRHICFRVFFSHRTTIRTYIKNAFLCTMDLVLFHNNIGFCRLSRSTSPHKVYRYVDWLTDSFSIRSQFVSINFTRNTTDAILWRLNNTDIDYCPLWKIFSYSANIDVHNLDETISGLVWYLKYNSTFAVMTTIYRFWNI
jgi:hypothetical protein